MESTPPPPSDLPSPGGESSSPPVMVGDLYEFRVVPFIANIALGQGSVEAAAQLQSVIDFESAQRWEYVRLESVETYVRGESGCLGIGGTESRWDRYKMIVFRRKK